MLEKLRIAPILQNVTAHFNRPVESYSSGILKPETDIQYINI